MEKMKRFKPDNLMQHKRSCIKPSQIDYKSTMEYESTTLDQNTF